MTEPGPSQQQTTGVVYIVDDDRELRESLAWLLESVAIRSVCFADVASFLRSYDPEQPACLILDVRMPGQSGFDLQQELNQLGSALPVVFVSAHGDIRMSVRALQQGAVDFLEKPYDPQHMVEVVQRALRDAGERFALAEQRSRMRQRMAALSQREREVLAMVVDGELSKTIATRLGISVKTVDVHRTRIREKMGAQSIMSLVRDVTELGLRVPPE